MAREKLLEAFERVKRLDASHVPFVSMPARVTEILRKAAGEFV